MLPEKHFTGTKLDDIFEAIFIPIPIPISTRLEI